MRLFAGIDALRGQGYHGTMDTIEYEAPSVTVVGTLESVTQGYAHGAHLDAPYASLTPDDKLTFS